MTAYSPIQLQGRQTMLETVRAVSEHVMHSPFGGVWRQNLIWDVGGVGLDVYPQQVGSRTFPDRLLSWSTVSNALLNAFFAGDTYVDYEENDGDYNGYSTIPMISTERWRVMAGRDGDWQPWETRYWTRSGGVIVSGVDSPAAAHFYGPWLHEDYRINVDPLRWTVLQLNFPADEPRMETSVERMYGESNGQASEAEAKSAAIAALDEGGFGTSSYAQVTRADSGDNPWSAKVQLTRVTHTMTYDVSAFDLGAGEGEYFLPAFLNCDLYVKPKAVGVFNAQGTANLTNGEHYRHATAMEDTDTFALGHLTAGSIVWPATPGEGETNTTGWDYDGTAPVAKWEFANYVDEE